MTAFTRLAIGLLLCVALGSCDSISGKGRESTIQFAYSWSQTIKVLGLSGLGRYSEVKRQQAHIAQVRTLLRAEGSEKLNKAADELEQSITYVSRSLTDNLEKNYAAVELDRDAARIPVVFPNAALNSRLGLDASGGDKSAKNALPALHEAIAEFARQAGVDKEFAKQLKTVEKSQAASDSTPLAWPDVREELLKAYLQTKVLRLEQRRVIEKLATENNAPLGFEGARWYMARPEVQTTRPNAKVRDDGYLEESGDWLGRPVKLVYGFGHLGLLEVVVRFTDAGSLASYEKTRAALEAAHGTMPVAAKSDEFTLVSKQRKGVVTIIHGLPANNIEQVTFKLTLL